MPKILLVTANFDLATRYGSYFLRSVVTEHALRNNWTLIELHAENAIYPRFLRALQEHNPQLVMMMGHGAETLITGQNYSDLLWIPPGARGHEHSDSNANLMRGRILYGLSCWAGLRLGAEIKRNGGRYMGYSKLFAWVTDERGNPEQDRYAAPFFRASNEIPKALMENKTPRQAYDASIRKHNEEIENWNRNTDAFASLVVMWLINNRDGTVLLTETDEIVEVESAEIGISPVLLLATVPIGFLALKK